MKNSILSYRPLLILLVLYVVIRITLTNINYTEWGDTFRMIRAAQYLSNFTWPFDEKRWPFYSVLLIPGIWLNMPVIYGRILSVCISVFFIVYSFLFYLKYIAANKRQSFISILLTISTPIYAYWSFRVMADPLFALLVMTFYYYYIRQLIIGTRLKTHLGLSILLLAITMTRLEGLFVVFSVIFTLFINKRFNLLGWYLLPQILIYAPFTIYAKFIYSGPVNNDYLEEVKTFNFDIARFEYFLAYTLFILVLPFFVYYIYNYFKERSRVMLKISRLKNVELLPVYLFIFQEVFLGFIWTPSLPRIYVPIISFLTMFAVSQIYESFIIKKKLFLFVNIISLIIYISILIHIKVINPGTYNFYFIAPTKIAFGLCIAFSVIATLLMVFHKSRIFLFSSIIILNLIVSSFVIYNQKDVYKSVMQSIEFIENQPSNMPFKVAYADETGLFDYYDLVDTRYNALHLPQNNNIKKSEQYILLSNDNIKYLLWTNEFNRGSNYFDPVEDSRFQPVFTSKVNINDLQSDLIDFMLNRKSDREFFISKVYLLK